MSTPLSVVALVSGGKDSFFSILHCLANGHRLVALANLHPPADSDEDMNSFMYQTVGTSLITLYETALGVPVYRQEIHGSAVIQDRDYRQQDDDETEALVPLLNKVKYNHPEVNAVSSGAILSTYQRTRVENVATRLNLTPLSFLWQYPLLPPYLQSSLLSDMYNIGQISKIIKVASGGLDESFLGENVADPKTVTRMKKALGRFSENGDGALVGEGGEFETLVVGGPSLLWRCQLEMQGPGNISRQDGGTAVWHASAKVTERPQDNVTLQSLRRPPIFDDEFSSILDACLTSSSTFPLPDHQSKPVSLPLNTHHAAAHEEALMLSNLSGAPRPRFNEIHRGKENVRLQFSNVLFRLAELLKTYRASAFDITHCTLLLRDMKDFALINELYAQFFNFTNPPSRVTVAVGDSMPESLEVMLTVIVHPLGPSGGRNGLHVQSQSYWAPANIGPYSQAIGVPLADGYEVNIAGQIPLDPPSMTLFTLHGFEGEALLALQHLTRIGRAQNVKWWVAGVAMIPASSDLEAQQERVSLSQAAWTAMHQGESHQEESDSEDVVDAWDRKNFSKAFGDTVARPPIPDYRIFEDHMQNPTNPSSLRMPPCIVVEVDALPRYAPIEWACTGLNISALQQEVLTTEPKYTIRDPANQFAYSVFEIPGEEEVQGQETVPHVEYGTLYASAKFDWEASSWAKSGISWIPCKRVWGEGGREVRGVLVARTV